MKKSQQFLLDGIKKVSDDFNVKLYTDLFKSMSDKEYKNWVETFVRHGILNLVVGNDPKLDTRKIENELKKLGGGIYGKLEYEDKDGKITKSPIDFYVVPMFTKIPTQTAQKGLSVSKGKSVNELTGQIKGAGKMTPPETGILYALGLPNVLKEVLSVRGGDGGLATASKAMINANGKYDLNSIDPYGTGATSTDSLGNFFKSIHLKLLD